jgi:hypothetical protein
MLVVEFLYRNFCKYIFPGVVSAGFSGMGPISVGDQFPGFLQEVGLRFGWLGIYFWRNYTDVEIDGLALGRVDISAGRCQVALSQSKARTQIRDAVEIHIQFIFLKKRGSFSSVGPDARNSRK